MSLVYPNVTDISLKSVGPVSMANINRVLSRLVANDVVLATDDANAPTVWECKWYNDLAVEGYPEGHAVWINVESQAEFIYNNHQLMYEYALKNSYLKDKITKLTSSSYSLYASILTGYNVPGTGMTLPPLYFLGELSAPAQIRISTVAGNKALPTDDSCWKDFNIDDDYVAVSAAVSSVLSTIFADHVDLYHFGDADNVDMTQYMLRDLSNADKVLQFTTFEDKTELEGLDYVKTYAIQPVQQTYLNSVIESISHSIHWKLKLYDTITNGGVVTTEAKSALKSKMSRCANYATNNIGQKIDELTDEYMIGILYTAASAIGLVPSTTDSFDDIKANAEMYNCSYEVVPLSTKLSSNIITHSDLYFQEDIVEVKTYPEVTYTGKRWFKQWRSGYLEHGGIVPVVNGNVSVDFNWEYLKLGQQYTAPSYAYPTTTKSFYGSHYSFKNDNSMKYDKTGNLVSDNRYNVVLTPIPTSLSSSLSGDGDAYQLSCSSDGVCLAAEVCRFTNNGFTAMVRGNAKSCMYTVTGMARGS